MCTATPKSGGISNYEVFSNLADNIQDCCNLCVNDKRCSSWVYYTDGSRQCHGHSTNTTANNNALRLRGDVRAPSPSPGPPPPPPPPPVPPIKPPAFPRFSWDTLPVYVHMCNRTGPFNDTSAKFLVKFPMVTIEKGQGEDTHVPTPYAEDNILAVARQVKALDPSVHVIAYFNSVLDWNMYRLHDKLLDRPDLWTYQAEGKNGGSRQPTRTHGDGSFPQPKDGMLSFNFSSPSGRNFWADACMNMTATGLIEGCFSDRASSDPTDLDPAWAKSFSAGHELMHQELQRRLSDAGKGVLISNNVQYDQVYGQMMEGFQANERSIYMLKACAAAGHLCQAHAGYRGTEHSSNCEDITDVLAAFLIGAGEHSYFGCSRGWYFDTWNHWNSEYDKKLGAPKGDGVKQGSVWTRSFASATVKFDTTTNKGEITWAS